MYQPEAQRELEALYQRYQATKPLLKGRPTTMAYRLHNLFLRRWNLWPRLICYRFGMDPTGRQVDSTNFATKQTIGWHVKECYRTMRGFKCQPLDRSL